MIVKGVAATHVGKVRHNNEDNFYLCGRYKDDPTLALDAAQNTVQASSYLFGVCDGMGGGQYGEAASLIAAKTLCGYAEDFDHRCEDYVKDANLQICKETVARNARYMGTTFAALSIVGEAVTAYNIGDSRIYLLRDGKLLQLSEDHTEVQMMLRHGFITKEDAVKHPGKHILTQHLGIPPEDMIITPYVSEKLTLMDGDIFLLCSDGLTDMLSDEEICSILCGNGRLHEKAQALLSGALDCGGRDNITVVLVRAVSDLQRIDTKNIEKTLRGFLTSGQEDLLNDILFRTKINML